MFSSSMKRGLRVTGGGSEGSAMVTSTGRRRVDFGGELSVADWNRQSDANKLRGMRGYRPPPGFKFVEDGSIVPTSY